VLSKFFLFRTNRFLFGTTFYVLKELFKLLKVIFNRLLALRGQTAVVLRTDYFAAISFRRKASRETTYF